MDSVYSKFIVLLLLLSVAKIMKFIFHLHFDSIIFHFMEIVSKNEHSHVMLETKGQLYALQKFEHQLK